MRKQACVMILGASLLAPVGVFAEGKEAGKADKKAPAAAGAPNQQAMMEALQKAASPGAQHQRLKAMAGTFDTVTRMWMAPDKPPQESKGKAENRMILDGRFLQQDYKGSFMGQPFAGVGLTGYDNLKKKYVGSWVDSMGTSLSVLEGSEDPSGKVLTMSMRTTDPTSGKEVESRTVTRIESEAKHVFEVYDKLPTGKEVKTMEIVYTRSK